MARTWGPWSEVKLDSLEKYLAAFTRASSRAKGTLYLDLFAGGPDNQSRTDGQDIASSPVRALETQPHFSKCAFFELSPRAARGLETQLRDRYPGRDITVRAGDCNVTCPEFLRDLMRTAPGWRLAPAFAFVDQYAAEIEWSTLASLSGFKQPTRIGLNKVELFLYFGDSFIPRGAHPDESGNPAFPNFAERVDRMFGNDKWRDDWVKRRDRVIDGTEFRDRLTNRMRWQLENDLGYRLTLPLSIVNRFNRPMYRMIFATDHAAGEKIMKSVFDGAHEAIDAMLRKAKADRLNENSPVGLFEAQPELYAPLNRERQIAAPPVDPDSFGT